MGFPMINFWAPFKKSIFRTQSTQKSLWINSTQICRYVHFWCRNWPDYLLVYTCCLSYILPLIPVLFFYQFDFCKHWQLDLNQVCHGQLAEALPLTYTDSCMLSSCGVFIFHLWPNVHFNSSVQPNTEDRIQGKLTSESMGVAVPPRAPWNFHFISYHIISIWLYIGPLIGRFNWYPLFDFIVLLVEHNCHCTSNCTAQCANMIVTLRIYPAAIAKSLQECNHSCRTYSGKDQCF